MNSACINCGSKQTRLIFSAPAFDSGLAPATDYFDVLRCKLCDLAFTGQVSTELLAAAYDADYYGAGEEKFLPVIESMITMLARAKAGAILRRWGRHSSTEQPADVLDIGCGRGVLLKAFRQHGANSLGLERPEFPVDETTEEFVEVGALSDSRYADRLFDIIVLWHVLEHLREPEALLQEISRHIKPDGVLVITVPNFSSLQRYLFGRHWFHLDLPRHLSHLEPHWLHTALEESGFSVETINYFDPLQSIFGFIQSALNKTMPGRLNRFYYLLKSPRILDNHKPLRVVGWLVAALILLPFAIIELIASSLFHRGCSIEVSARFRGNND